jgi:hypothetical protein
MTATLSLGLGRTENGRAGTGPALRIWKIPVRVVPEAPQTVEIKIREPNPVKKIKFRKFARVSWINKYSVRASSG